MKRKRQKWEIGVVFLVQTDDGKYVPGQVIGREPIVLNSVSVAFFDERVDIREGIEAVELKPEAVFASVFATRDLLDSGDWKVIERRTINIPIDMHPHEDKRHARFVGARVIGSGILNALLNAFYGLAPWDDWHDPDYLDSLLIDPSKKPSGLNYKSSH